MKTPAFRAPARPRNDDSERPLAVTIGLAIWENSPILLAIDIAFAIACLPALLVAGSGGLVVAPILLAVLGGPVWIAALKVSEAILDGEIVGTRRLVSMINSGIRPGLKIAIIPGVIATVLLGTLALAGSGDRRWMIAPAILDGLVLSGVVVVALGAGWFAARGEPINRSLWRNGAMLAGSSPQAIGGIIAVAVLIGISAQLIGPLMIVTLAAPFAVFVCATFRWVAASHRIDLDA
jgi:hypothetical protein